MLSRIVSRTASAQPQQMRRLSSLSTSQHQHHQQRQQRQHQRWMSTAIVQHRNTSDNNPSTPFQFTPANLAKAQKILAKFPSNYKQSAVMPLLTLAQEQNDNWLPLSAMNAIAEMLDMPRIRVYEVATFYSMYNRTKVGKYHIQLCGTTPCQLCGSEELIAAVEKHLSIKCGETTKDGMFTLNEVECLGACANAPMIQVNNHEFYENLTPQSIVALIEKWKRGEVPTPGPQNGQKYASGIQGKTSLFENPERVVCRDLDALKEQVRKDAEAAATAARQQPKSA